MARATLYSTNYGQIVIPLGAAARLGPHTIVGQPDKRSATARRDERYFRLLANCMKAKWIAGEV